MCMCVFLPHPNLRGVNIAHVDLTKQFFGKAFYFRHVFFLPFLQIHVNDVVHVASPSKLHKPSTIFGEIKTARVHGPVSGKI
jgi:hypothetical protein